MVDIARPDLPVARRRRRLVLGGAALLVLAVLSCAVSRLQPAAPVVERASVWVDTVKRGPLVREVRGTGTLVPEDLRWIPAVAEGRVDRIRLRPGARVGPGANLARVVNPARLKAELRIPETQAKDVQLGQRAAIARAVVGDPAILLCDEPTGNLDSKNGALVMDLLQDLHAAGATICMVTHDPRYADRAKRTIHLFDGRLGDGTETAE